MDLLLASAAPDDVTTDLHRRLSDAGHRIRHERDVEGCDALIVLVSLELDTDGLVDLMTLLPEARGLGVAVVGVTACPPEKHPPAIGALALGEDWVRLDEDEGQLAIRLAELDARSVVTDLAREDSAGAPAQEATRVETKEEKAELQIFISYSRDDSDLVKDVVGELRRRGIGVWVDTLNITGGTPWRGSIERGIRRSDVVVVFLSPNVVRSPRWIEAELAVAQTEGKRIIPVQLKRTPPPLPDGFGLMLSGTQVIDLVADYGAGLEKLVADLGGATSPAAAGGVLARVRRAGRHAKRLAKQYDVGSKVAFVGAAALAVAGAVAAANAQNQKERQAEEDERRAGELRQLTAQQVAARERYAERTIRLLADGMTQMDHAAEVSPADYRREVKPEMMRIIGNLEAGRPTGADSEFVARHDQLVKDLDQLVAEFDRLADKIERGEVTEHTARRIVHAYSNTSTSALRWLKQVLGID